MERFRIKNIIILILALFNLFLLLSLFLRFQETARTQNQKESQLIELYQQSGIILPRSVFTSSKNIRLYALNRSLRNETLFASAFLGLIQEDHDLGGGIHSVSGNLGTALFRDNGNFEITLSLSSENLSSFLQVICEDHGYVLQTTDIDESGNGTITAKNIFNRTPCRNGGFTAVVHDHKLVQVEGTYLPKSYQEVQGKQELISCYAALTELENYRRSTGAVFTEIEQVSLSYEIQSTSSASISVVPAWFIETNGANYYVNCLTSSISVP